MKILNSRRRLVTGVSAALLLLPATGKPKESWASEEDIDQPNEQSESAFIRRAFEMRDLATANGDQGFGGIVVRDGLIVGQAPSRVVTNNDPTAHAEIEAIRDAAKRLNSRRLDGCILYSSFRPCPMCESAAYWAGIARMVSGANATDGGAPHLC